jgi:hypothetical protein
MERANNGGFDVAEVEGADGSRRSMSRVEYEAMPLSDRISMVLRRKVEFYRDGVKISPQEALKI